MAYPKVRNFRGAWFDLVTHEMVVELAAVSSVYVNPMDGCGSLQGKTVQDADTGRVFTLTETGASSDTHDGEGAGDLAVDSDEEGRRLETDARRLGNAAFYRPKVNPYTGKPYGWGRHVHFLRIGAALSPSALDQVQDYKAGLDGLSPARKDTGSRAYVDMTWAKYKEANVTNEQMQRLLAAIAAVPAKTATSVWGAPLTVDPDGDGPRQQITAPARTYLMMADVFANKAMYNTDSLESTMAALRSQVAAGDPDVDKALDEIEAALAALAEKVDALAPKA